MHSDDAGRLTVRLALLSADGVVVLRLRLRFRALLPASVVLGALLRRAVDERRRGCSLRVERAPEDLLLLLALCGLDPEPLAVRR